jgi:hypothetical protein
MVKIGKSEKQKGNNNMNNYIPENLRISRTLRAWRAIGIDCKIVNRQVRLSNGKLRTESGVCLRGVYMTKRAFAKRFPYAANPSV